MHNCVNVSETNESKLDTCFRISGSVQVLHELHAALTKMAF